MVTLLDDMLDQRPLPLQLRRDYIHSLQRIKQIPVDVVVPSHPDQMEDFPLEWKGKNPYIDSERWGKLMDHWIARMEEVIRTSRYPTPAENN